jgi:signal transduction histidine kinase/phage shock protein PspC (stress-responsive transcriptional regulator)
VETHTERDVGHGGGHDAPGDPSGVPSAGAAALTPRKAFRTADDRYLGGVCGGLAAHLGVPVMWVRVAFVATAVFSGLGVLMYAGLWLVLPLEHRTRDVPQGIAAATRQGKRPAARQRGLDDIGPLVALAALAVGGLLLVRQLGFGFDSVFFWPVVLATVGLTLLWRQADEAQRARWTDATGRLGPLQAVLGGGGMPAVVRILVGLLLLVTAIGALVAQSGNIDLLDDVLIATVLAFLGLGLIAWPWVYRLTRDLGEERSERIRSQERADMAAHLHDSVLQTLALIQKQADDPRTVARLARAQERDLRAWLYDDPGRSADTLAAALRAAAAEVEDAHGVPVEVVTVGDRPLGTDVDALAKAAREAMVNAAKHSGAEKVDVFAEVMPGLVEVFVRDRGRGFEPARVPPDRLGVRGSIVDRMRRHGGEAEVRSVPGEGTEIRLRLRTPAGEEHR